MKKFFSSFVWSKKRLCVALSLVLAFASAAEFGAVGAQANPAQFPHNPNEIINWGLPGHNFQRVVITTDSNTIRINGQERPVDVVAAAVPFVDDGILQVPITAAQRAMGTNVTWQINGTSVTATRDTVNHTVTGTLSNNVLFVPLQTIAAALNQGAAGAQIITVGWDEPRAATTSPAHSGAVGTLVVTTGIIVSNGNIGNVGSNAQSNTGAGGQLALGQAAQWLGSPESLRLAENYYIWQRQWVVGGELRGGWPTDRNMNELLTPARRTAILNERTGNPAPTLDDNATFPEIRYLLRIYEATGITRFHTAAMRGLNAILGVQYPNGGFPQGLRNPTGTAARITFNDNAMLNTVNFLNEIARNPQNFPSVPPETITRAGTAVQNAIGAIVSLQVRSGAFADGQERLTAWGAQHNQNAPHEPVWARHFEPPSISGSESIGIMRFLMGIENPSREVVEAVHAAMFFFNYVEILGYQHTGSGGARVIVPAATPTTRTNLWARFICVDTFEPLIYDRRSPNAHATNPPGGAVSVNWPGVLSSNSAGGIRRNLYGNPGMIITTPTFDRHLFSTNPDDGLHLPASFANLSWERRGGYTYFGNWPNGVRSAYNTWAARHPLPQPSPSPAPSPSPSPLPSPEPSPTPTPDPAIIIRPASAIPGGRVTVAVDITNNPGFTEMDLNITYDYEMLTLRHAEAGLLFSNGFVVAEIDNVTSPSAISFATTPSAISLPPPGEIHLAWRDADNQATNGTLLWLTFDVEDVSDDEETNGVLTEIEIESVKIDSEVPLKIEDAFVFVYEYLLGDVTEDGRVSMVDITRLARYIAQHEVPVPSMVVSDVDGNGKLDTFDIITLGRFVMRHFGIYLVPGGQ